MQLLVRLLLLLLSPLLLLLLPLHNTQVHTLFLLSAMASPHHHQHQPLPSTPSHVFNYTASSSLQLLIIAMIPPSARIHAPLPIVPLRLLLHAKRQA
jgi:hypothetical protein